MNTLKVIGGLVFIILIGCAVGSIAFIPIIRKKAIQFPIIRQLLTLLLSSIAFLPFFLLITLFFSAMSQIGFYGNREGQERWVALDNELWIHFMLPEIVLSNDTCVTGDSDVCTLAMYILEHERNTLSYVISWIFALIPALSCAFMVRYITRDNRKVKYSKT